LVIACQEKNFGQIEIGCVIVFVIF